MADGTPPGWNALEAREGWSGLRQVIRDESRALAAGASDMSKRKRVSGSGCLCVVIMVGGLLFAQILGSLIGSAWGGAFQALFFFPLALLAIAAVLWREKDVITERMVIAAKRERAKTRWLEAAADHVGLRYVSQPGGAHPLLGFLGRQSWTPSDLKREIGTFSAEAEDSKTASPRLMAALEAAESAGQLGAAPVVLGNQAQKDAFQQSRFAVLGVEDGFVSDGPGLPFAAFEYSESQGDDDTVHHLVMVFDLERPAHGVTQLASRGLSFPSADGENFKTVDLGPAFRERYRVRSNDQVEARVFYDPAVMDYVLALSEKGKVNAVLKGGHAVFRFPGKHDRFSAVAHFSEEGEGRRGRQSRAGKGAEVDADTRMRRALADIAHMQDLAAAFGRVAGRGRA